MSYCEIPGDNVVKLRKTRGGVDGVFVCQLRFTKGQTVIHSPSRIGRKPVDIQRIFQIIHDIKKNHYK